MLGFVMVVGGEDRGAVGSIGRGECGERVCWGEGGRGVRWFVVGRDVIGCVGGRGEGG